jgi:hypothetical protein
MQLLQIQSDDLMRSAYLAVVGFQRADPKVWR